MEEKFRKVLTSLLPEGTLDFVVTFFILNNVSLTITRPRSSRFGSFLLKNRRPVITINNNLTPFHFFIVMLHEMAHYITYRDNHPRKTQPHGQEWKNNFKALIHQTTPLTTLPQPIQQALDNYVAGNFSSTSAKFALNAVLLGQQKPKSGTVKIFELPEGASFLFKSKVFTKQATRRSRCICKRVIEPNKLYSFHLLTEVEPIN